MSVENKGIPGNLVAGALNIDNILELSSKSKIGANIAPGRRARKRKMRAAAARTSLLAPLLAAEGCKTLGADNLQLGSDISDEPLPETVDFNGGSSSGGGSNTAAPSGGGSSAATGGLTNGPTDSNGVTSLAHDDFFTGVENQNLQLTVNDVLANDIELGDGRIELVRVFDAVNGTVFFDGEVIEFRPTDEFVGAAQFSYEIRDSDGNLHVARVDLSIQPDAQKEGPNAGNDAAQVAIDDGQDHVDMTDGDMPGGMTGGMPGGMAGGDGSGSMAHPDDPAKASEHMALLSLVPVAEATNIAVNSGSWFDPTTWANGEVPGEGAKVLISEGVSVTYDRENDASLFTVRVDGTLEFSTTKDTFMEVDTLVVSPTGRMTIGTVDNPVNANVSAVIQIADNGPIDTSWDTQLLSRGVLSHGTVEIHGAEKDTYLKVASDPMRGDTSLTLEEVPNGWEVGDSLVLTGTRLPNLGNSQANQFDPETVTEDEELVITGIDGNTIFFDRPLEYDHDGPRADLKAYVANFTRNVKIQTENFDDIPVHQRGHVMLMHSDNIDVRYGEFLELGRTDKSVRAFDTDDLASVESDSNVKGRYSLHIHRAGVGDLDDPAMLVGNAIWGSPGWGVTHHDSNAVITDNAVYNAFGSAFVAETGNETGRWTSNIAIKSIGASSGPKDGPDVIAFDNARGGSGFWFQGRTVDAVDNVAAGIPSGHGFVYMSRGQGAGTIKINPEDAPQPEALRYSTSAEIYLPAISSFVGNEAFAVERGLEVIKPGPKQGHDIRSVISDFTAWEVKVGAYFQYTAHYTVENLDVLAARDPAIGTEWGVVYFTNTLDFVINGARIDGFNTGVSLTKNVTVSDFDGQFDYVFVDVEILNAQTQYFNLDGGDRIVNGADLIDTPTVFTPDAGGIGDVFFPAGASVVTLSGIKSDALGDIRVGGDWDLPSYNRQSLNNAIIEEGWWTLPDGRNVTVLEQFIADRLTGDLQKISNIVSFDDNATSSKLPQFYNGVFDANSAAPIGVSDSATVSKNGSVVIDVLANDSDPDGDSLRIDGIQYAENGSVFVNDDGTITYQPDPNFTGTDEFWYWVEDDNANLTKTYVQVTVDI